MCNESAEGIRKAFNVKIKLDPQKLELLNVILSQAQVSRTELFERFIWDILHNKIAIENRGIVIREPVE